MPTTRASPILFYQFDLDQYNKTNGSYIDMETELWGDRCAEQAELIQLIKKYAENGFQEKAEICRDAQRIILLISITITVERTYEYIKSQGF